MANYRFIRKLADGSTYHLGTACQYADGWRFIPNVSSHRSSRKFHATMEKCIPRWVGYPDRCESFAVGGDSCAVVRNAATGGIQTEVIGDPGTEWTDNPRALTEAERDQIKAAGRLDGIKLHRQFTNSTLLAAKNAVEALQGWK